MGQKSAQAYRTISEVAEELDVQPHVLRFWETKFKEIKPLKRRGNRRYYSAKDITLLKKIRHLLYSEGYTIKGVQKLLKQGVEVVAAEITSGQDNTPSTQPKSTLDAIESLGFEPVVRQEISLAIQELKQLQSDLLSNKKLDKKN